MISATDAAEHLSAGQIVVVPTDTTYGIAADPTRRSTIAAVFDVKGRPLDKPLPLLADCPQSLDGIAVWDSPTRKVFEAFWPGPLTLVLERADGYTHDLGGASASIAVRVPAHAITLEILRLTGPLAVTSANRSGDRPALSVSEARGALEPSIQHFVDGGVCDGVPSTVVSLTGHPKMLRAGPVPFEEVLQALSL